MLALTPTAAEAVEAIVTQSEAPEGAALRTSSEAGEPDPGGEETRDRQLAGAAGAARRRRPSPAYCGTSRCVSKMAA